MDRWTIGLTANFAKLVLAALVAAATAAVGPVSAQTTLFQEPEITVAAAEGNIARIRQLLAQNTHVNRQDSKGRTALIAAAIAGQPDVAAMLLEAGARTDLLDKLGNSALSWAAAQGEAEIVRRLIEAGADVDSQNRQGQTPLMLAAAKGRLQPVQLLLEAGADVAILDYTGRGVLGWARDGRDPRVERILEDAGAMD